MPAVKPIKDISSKEVNVLTCLILQDVRLIPPQPMNVQNVKVHTIKPEPDLVSNIKSLTTLIVIPNSPPKINVSDVKTQTTTVQEQLTSKTLPHNVKPDKSKTVSHTIKLKPQEISAEDAKMDSVCNSISHNVSIITLIKKEVHPTAISIKNQSEPVNQSVTTVTTELISQQTLSHLYPTNQSLKEDVKNYNTANKDI